MRLNDSILEKSVFAGNSFQSVWLSHVRSSVIVVMYIVRRHEDVKPLCLLSLCKAFLYSSWLEIMSASIRGLQTILLYCVIKPSTMLLLLNSTWRDVTNWALVVFYCMFIVLVLLCSRTIVHCWYVYTVCMYVFTCSSNNKTVRLNNGLDNTFVCDLHSMVQRNTDRDTGNTVYTRSYNSLHHNQWALWKLLPNITERLKLSNYSIYNFSWAGWTVLLLVIWQRFHN